MGEGFIVRRSGGGFNKSVIIVTAPVGSTVTCSKGSVVKSATEKNGEWIFKNLDNGVWTIKAVLGRDIAQKNYNVTQFGVYRIKINYSSIPEFTYSVSALEGGYELVDDSDSPIRNPENYQGNWKIRFLKSGDFRLDSETSLDVFLVGGGGGSSSVPSNGGGGGGGYTKTMKNFKSFGVTPVIIGSGTTGVGGKTSFGSISVDGGQPGNGTKGGPGGSGGGNLARDGLSDGIVSPDGGQSQGSTTREFGIRETGRLYAGGGAGATKKGGAGGGGDGDNAESASGKPNTGGGGGYNRGAHPGGSGIVVIRNARG